MRVMCIKVGTIQPGMPSDQLLVIGDSYNVVSEITDRYGKGYTLYEKKPEAQYHYTLFAVCDTNLDELELVNEKEMVE